MPMRPALYNAVVFSLLWGRWESLWNCSNCWEGAHRVLRLTVFSFASRTRLSVSRILSAVMKSSAILQTHVFLTFWQTDSTVVSLSTVGDRKLDQRLVWRFVLCTWFKSRLDCLWIFRRFPQPLKEKAPLDHRIHHNGFPTNTYQLIFHQLSCHRCCKTGATIILLK